MWQGLSIEEGRLSYIGLFGLMTQNTFFEVEMANFLCTKNQKCKWCDFNLIFPPKNKMNTASYQNN